MNERGNRFHNFQRSFRFTFMTSDSTVDDRFILQHPVFNVFLWPSSLVEMCLLCASKRGLQGLNFA